MVNKTERVKWGRGKREANGKLCTAGDRDCDGYLVYRLLHRLPGNGARNPSCYFLSTALVFPEEEGMMQQSSVSISLSF